MVVFAPLLCLSYITEVNKRKLSTAGKKKQPCTAQVSGVITEQYSQQHTSKITNVCLTCGLRCIVNMY